MNIGKMIGKLAGKKTYISGGVTIAGAVLAAATKQITPVEAVNIIVPAVLGMTVRAGVSTEMRKAAW